MAKLVFGLKDNKLVHVDKVEQGIKCDCNCPNCNEKLIARQGDINEHHFAHIAKECDISVAQETALHIMAKDILAEYKIIRLPEINMKNKYGFFTREEFKNIDNKIDKSMFKTTHQTGKEFILKFDEVYLEKLQKDIIPDLFCISNNQKYYIEIAVTNFIRNKKYNKIREQQISTIEIDLSQYKDKIETLTKRRLSDILIDDLELKKWIYHPNIEEIINYNKNEIEKQLIKYKEICSMFLPENYIENQYKYNDKRHAINFWNKQKISNKIKNIPWFVGYPIYGDFIFQVDRRIWQAFIINLMHDSFYPYKPSGLWKYIKDKPFLRLNSDFLEPIWISDNLKYSAFNVVNSYYEFLQSNKIIDEEGRFIYVK